MDLNFQLHQKQLEAFESDKRFKICVAGRRGGKSHYALVELLVNGMQEESQNGISLIDKEVWYVAPTFQQAKDIMWNKIKTLGGSLIRKTHENTATVELINGRRIQLKGSDRPDSLRGVGISFVCMDEYAFMKPEVWDLIIQPTLADVKGKALFIGTPEGKNHFYDLWVSAQEDDSWGCFHWTSLDNPIIDDEEIERAKMKMSTDAFRQEFEASFVSGGSGHFKEETIQYADSSDFDGDYYIAVDPAGFGTGDGLVSSNLKRLDETAIAVVKVGKEGWLVDHIDHGRWDIRETSIRILKAAQDYKPVCVGIEKGSLKNAIMPYLEDQMRRLGVYPRIEELTHGGKKKQERILWALQGRFQHGRVFLKKAKWNKRFVEQLLDFPNPMTHDDLIDAVSYIDQLSQVVYSANVEVDDWKPQDLVAGY